MYKIPARTLFAGKNLVYVPQCHSTNSLAAELAQKVETPEGTVVVTDEQTTGKGQRGSTWESEPFRNLTFSLVLKPRFLGAKEQFRLNQAIVVGIADYISGQVTQQVAIKWPNDILVREKKVCGILIENHLSGESIVASIVGIGVNMNQKNFKHPNAASLWTMTGKDYELAHELETLLHDIEVRYMELKASGAQRLDETYLGKLYRRGQRHLYRVDGQQVKGTILGTSDEGKLRAEIEGKERLFGVKEIEFL